jgi:hypothetical protein
LILRGIATGFRIILERTRAKMGDIGSGNHGGKPAVEDGLVLDLDRLIR